MGGILDCLAVDSRVITEALKTAASVAGIKVMGISLPKKKHKTQKSLSIPRIVNQIVLKLIPIDDDGEYLILYCLPSGTI